MNQVPKWRLAAGTAVLAALAFFGIKLIPLYLHNLELQRFVEVTAHLPETREKSDDLLRTWVLDKAQSLDLPVKQENVEIKRTQDQIRIGVRYIVRVDLPLYTVDLHFYPGAGSN